MVVEINVSSHNNVDVIFCSECIQRFNRVLDFDEISATYISIIIFNFFKKSRFARTFRFREKEMWFSVQLHLFMMDARVIMYFAIYTPKKSKANTKWHYLIKKNRKIKIGMVTKIVIRHPHPDKQLPVF